MLLKAVIVFFQVTAAAVVKLLFISRAKRNKKTVKEHGVFNG